MISFNHNIHEVQVNEYGSENGESIKITDSMWTQRFWLPTLYTKTKKYPDNKHLVQYQQKIAN